jgi:glyoxylase-like metal-dependent hydrolase (beta-lactamase superfamily II)
MKIKRFKSKFFESNTYLVIKGQTAIIVDPSVELSLIKKELEDLKISGILLTHGHADHFVYLKEYHDFYQCLIYCHQKALEKIEDPEKNYSKFGDAKLSFHFPKTSYSFLKEGQTFHIDNFEIKIMETPGHSDCSICFLIEDSMFSGDTLFKGTVGRTDLYSSNIIDLNKSLNKIFNLNFDYFIYPGHDESSLLSIEKISNRFLRRAKD